MEQRSPLIFINISELDQQEFDLAWILVTENDFVIQRRQYIVKPNVDTLVTNNDAYYFPFVKEELKRILLFYQPSQVVFDGIQFNIFKGKVGFDSSCFVKVIQVERLAKERGIGNFANLDELAQKLDTEGQNAEFTTLKKAELLRKCYFKLLDRNLSMFENVKGTVSAPFSRIMDILNKHNSTGSFGVGVELENDASRTRITKQNPLNKGEKEKGCLYEIGDLILNLFFVIIMIDIGGIVIALIVQFVRFLINFF